MVFHSLCIYSLASTTDLIPGPLSSFVKSGSPNLTRLFVFYRIVLALLGSWRLHMNVTSSLWCPQLSVIPMKAQLNLKISVGRIAILCFPICNWRKLSSSLISFDDILCLFFSLSVQLQVWQFCWPFKNQLLLSTIFSWISSLHLYICTYSSTYIYTHMYICKYTCTYTYICAHYLNSGSCRS